MVSINERGDGRVEVIDDGRVIWCGHDRTVAQAVIRGLADKSPDEAAARRVIADHYLPRAIDAMRLA